VALCVISGQLGGGGTIQQPDHSVRSHKSCRQLPVGILLRFKNGFDNIGFTVAAGQEQYHSRLVDHT
jgi:hypothetical protein